MKKPLSNTVGEATEPRSGPQSTPEGRPLPDLDRNYHLTEIETVQERPILRTGRRTMHRRHLRAIDP